MQKCDCGTILKSDVEEINYFVSHFLSFIHSSMKLYASLEGINDKKLKREIKARAFIV